MVKIKSTGHLDTFQRMFYWTGIVSVAYSFIPTAHVITSSFLLKIGIVCILIYAAITGFKHYRKKDE